MCDIIKHDALLWLVVFSTALIGAFRSLLWFAPSAVRCRLASYCCVFWSWTSTLLEFLFHHHCWCCQGEVLWNCFFDPVFVVTKVTINRIHRIPCEWGKVYNGETGRPMQDRIKEHDRDIRLARTETSAVSGHAHNTRHKPLWNEVKFIDLDPFYYTRRVKEPIHIRLHPENINRDSGIEIPEAWIPTIKKHNNRRATLPLSQDLPNFPQH